MYNYEYIYLCKHDNNLNSAEQIIDDMTLDHS